MSKKVLGCAIEVHKHLGPGLLESTYQNCLAFELTQQDIPFRKEVSFLFSTKVFPSNVVIDWICWLKKI